MFKSKAFFAEVQSSFAKGAFVLAEIGDFQVGIPIPRDNVGNPSSEGGFDFEDERHESSDSFNKRVTSFINTHLAKMYYDAIPLRIFEKVY